MEAFYRWLISRIQTLGIHLLMDHLCTYVLIAISVMNEIFFILLDDALDVFYKDVHYAVAEHDLY